MPIKRPITIFCIRNTIDVNADLDASPEWTPGVRIGPALTPFTRPMFRMTDVVGTYIPIWPVNPSLGNSALWLVSFAFPSSPGRISNIKERCRQARDTDGNVWLYRGEVPETPANGTTLRAIALLWWMESFVNDDTPAEID